MKTKIIPFFIALTFSFSFIKGQDTLPKEKYIELVRYNKSHDTIAVSKIKKDRRVKVYYDNNGNKKKIKGRLHEINESYIVVKYNDLEYMNLKDTIHIDSIASICKKKGGFSIPFLVPGSMLTLSGAVFLHYGISNQFFYLIGYSSFACLMHGIGFTFIGLSLTTIGIITACSWNHFDTSIGWEISVKEKTIK